MSTVQWYSTVNLFKRNQCTLCLCQLCFEHVLDPSKKCVK